VLHFNSSPKFLNNAKEGYQRFGGRCSFHLHREDHDLNLKRSKKLKSLIICQIEASGIKITHRIFIGKAGVGGGALKAEEYHEVY